MKYYINAILLILICLCCTKAFSQEFGNNKYCYSSKHRLAARTTVGNAAEDNYDVKYVKLNLKMTNTATTLSGDVLTKAISLIPSFSSYYFELDSLLTIDSVLVNGINCTVSSVGDIRTATLAAPIGLGSLFTVQVFYNGTPISGTLYNALGINSLASPSWGTLSTFTLSESYHAKEWWPCKQSLHDKIDSCDIWLTVADSLKAGSNGVLSAITTIDSNHVRYEWKERYPIDYYLISAAVGPYIDYSYYMHFTGSTDSMLVQNYVYNNPGTLPYFKSVIDSTGMMIDYFSTIYGRYPFWHEKYGHCMGALGGGMEHQTMTTLGFFEGSIDAHELGHQWFGDNVTCGTWADIFSNEGFASYTEDLFIEHFRSHALSLTDMQSKQNDVKSIDTGTIYVDDTTNEGRIFDSRLSYNKGACALHMLRFITNNDSVFFQAYKNYQQQLKDSVGTIMDFKNVYEATTSTNVNGIDIDTFFNQWFYLQGFPKYVVKWNQIGADVYVELIQTTAVPSSVPLFKLPIEIKFNSISGDTIIRFNNNASSQVYHFTYNKTVESLNLDPNYWLVYDLISMAKDPNLSVDKTISPEVNIYPNPTNTVWQAENIPINSELILSDVTGRIIWQAVTTNKNIQTIPAKQLVSGLYFLKINNKDCQLQTFKLMKQ